METNNSLAKKYDILNTSFRKTCVFRLGSDSGFFSNYNNMVFAIAYCLKHKIKFILSSNDSNFSKVGWEDFFLPFCPQNTDEFHLVFNFRNYSRPPIKHLIKRKFNNILFRSYLTQDIWNKFRHKTFEEESFIISDLNMNGKLFEACKVIIGLTWRFNTPIINEVTNIIEDLKLPNKYNSIHIRKGDKVTEVNDTSTQTYVDRLVMSPDLKDVFVATDDYNVIIELENLLPDYNFFHLTDKKATGYIQANFENSDEISKRYELIKLLTSMEIMNNSEYVFCTYSSNVGLFLAMRRGTKTTFDVNNLDLHIW